MDTIDYYSILQIEPDATEEEIRAAYKRLAFLYHPDRSDHPQSTQQMQLLNDAFAVLGNQEKRARYDLDRSALTAPAPIEKSPSEDLQVDHQAQKEQEHKRNLWLRSQLKVILRLIVLTTILFIWSLVTGEINFVVILIFVLIAVYIVASMVIRIKNLVR